MKIVRGLRNVVEVSFVLCVFCVVIEGFTEVHHGDDVFSNSIGKSNHIIIAPEILRPNIPFGIMIHVFDDVFNQCSNKSFNFYASIFSSSRDIISSTIEHVFCNAQQIVNLPIPISLTTDNYTLHAYATGANDKRRLFDNSLQLLYEPNFVSVIFQTTRPIYSSGQTVNFRIVVLQTSLIPFNDVMDVFVLDPSGLVMKRWLSVYTNNGVATLKFKLPKLAKDGVWKIRSQINNQIDEKTIVVETYFQPFFEVIVSSSPFIVETDENMAATIYGIYPTQKLVRGNATITWLARKFQGNITFLEIKTESVLIKEMRHQAVLPLDTVRKTFENLAGIEIKISVYMTEFMSGETMSGFSHTRIITSDIIIRFLSKPPVVFTPGMPLNGHVFVSYDDHEKIPREVLEKSTVKVEIQCDSVFSNGKRVLEIITEPIDEDPNDDFYNVILRNRARDRYLDDGIIAYNFDIPVKAMTITLKATFHLEGKFKEISISTVKRYSPDGKYISLWTSSVDLKVYDYAMFHTKSNFAMNNFYSLVLSKGILLQIQEHDVGRSSLVSFSIPVSGDMAPLFHVIMYAVSNDHVVRSDAVTVPVDGFSRYETTFEVNTGKDFRNERVEALTSGGEGAFIGIQAMRSIVYRLQGGNEITRSRMTNNFLKFEKNFKSICKIDWITRDGNSPEKSVYFPAHNFVFDERHSLELNRLKFWSNFNQITYFDQEDKCEQKNEFPCLLNGCVPKSEVCDAKFDCIDGSDESNCIISENTDKEYYLNRISRNYFIYDAEEGDWGFFEIKKNDHVGVEFQFMSTPATADDWYFTAINMHMIYGFSMVEEPVIFSSAKPLMAHVLGPNKCHRGEQLGLKLHLHNHDRNRMLVIATLLGSPDYRFINVERDGIVSSYDARSTSGDHQILIYMPGESETEIRIPVAPSVELGIVEINFLVSSQAGRANISHVVDVKGEGALINRHTSITLDLKNRGFTLEYLDVIVEENPYVPYEYWRRYVYGSPAAKLTLSNDVIGPINFDDQFTLNKMLRRESKGAVDFVFELNANIWILHYLRLTNQLNHETLKYVLNECNSLYSTIIRYFSFEGFFTNWEPTLSYPSVWLSAWVIRVLKFANFPEWQFMIWIDPFVIKKTLQWLLAYQQPEGFFIETTEYNENPLDSRFVIDNITNYRTTLTAHVLITLQIVVEFAEGELRSRVVISILNARKYLEKKLPSVRDPYLLAMISYAFLITDSPYDETAFSLLHKSLRVNEDGCIYWSKTPIPSNPVKIENQKPYRMPRLYQETDSYAVEATSWALLVYIANEGITLQVENIVKWLISMKMSNFGFISVVDTSVAYHALTEYTFRSRFLDLTNIRVTIEMMASNVTTLHLHIANKSFTSFQAEMPFVWGHVNIAGKGAGMAYLQMDVNYGVDHEHLVDHPQSNIFDLHFTEFYSRFRNKSIITVQSCLRYTRDFPLKSGAAVLEIQIPTGYFLLETQANEIVSSKLHPSLRDVRTTEGKTVWFFDFLDRELHCFNHSIKRWYPVGNMTLCRQALLYELTAREHFVQVLINSTALYTLSICEVCGSFQCPYCPYYNKSVESAMFEKILLLSVLFVIIFNLKK